VKNPILPGGSLSESVAVLSERESERASWQPGLSAGTPCQTSISGWVYALAVLGTILHFAFSGRYGYFRDELYYAACGEHLAWGYVDHAPFVALTARVSRAIWGDSLFAVRFFPALAAAAKVYMAGWMARELNGGHFAQSLAALAVLLAPIYLTFDSFLSMNSFEPLFWMACAAILLRILNGANERLWLLFGLVAGIGILNKHSMLFFISGVFGGLCLTPARRELTKRWVWLAGVVAFVIFLPNLLWEIEHGWPTIALLHAVIGTKYSTVTPWEFIWQQSLLTHPLATPIWLAGLGCLLFDTSGKRYAALGFAYLIVLVELIALHGKIYYLAPAYPMLFAAGAAWIERQVLPRAGVWLKPVAISVLIVGGLTAAPLAMPILPAEYAVKYCRFWNVESVHVETMPLGELPQFFADMYGWPEQVDAVASVFNALSPEDREKCAVLAYNYGEAGAIDYLGPARGLPKAISGHNQYALWGPGGYSGDVVIAIGFSQEQLREIFDDVRPATKVTSHYAMPEETNLTVFICRRPKRTLEDMWAKLHWLG
jgi:Dolichyl-phosphate-mannose-protein mannosyltransferase